MGLFWMPLGFQRGSFGSLEVSFGDLEVPNQCTISDSGGIMGPEWLPDLKKEQFWVTLGCFLYIFCTKCNVFVQDCGDFRSYF